MTNVLTLPFRHMPFKMQESLTLDIKERSGQVASYSGCPCWRQLSTDKNWFSNGFYLVVSFQHLARRIYHFR